MGGRVRVFSGADELFAAVGQTVGSSEWLTVEQQQIDQFAEATGDHQWIHVDPERAAEGPFGATIAHGYLTLSLLPALVKQIYRIEARMAINYGLNRVRFPSPVRVGSRVRATATIRAVEPLDGGVQVMAGTVIEIEGGPKPACVAENVGRYLL